MGRDAEIGAVDVTVPVSVTVGGKKLLAHGLAMPAPVLNADHPTHGVGTAFELLNEPIGRHHCVGIGKGEPADLLR